MTNLQLEFDEGILLQTTEVERYCHEEQYLDEMILTNKNIICVYEKSNGFFATSDTVTEIIPLSTIKVVNGKVQAMIYDNDDYGNGLQILFADGHREHFIFNTSPKKTMPLWLNAITEALVPQKAETPPIHSEGIAATPPVQNVKNEVPSQGKEASTNQKFDINGLFEKAQSKFEEFAEKIDNKLQELQQEEKVTSKVVEEKTIIPAPIPTPEPKQEPERKHSFCSNCGTKLNEGAKFCHNCGAPIGTVKQEEPIAPIPQEKTIEEQQHTERQQEYVGTILKCPHCGAILTETTAICPDCGMHLTGKKAVHSVQAFKDELMNLDNSRVGGLRGMLLSNSTLVDPVDKKKVSLIQNFPIPNSVDDIIEFMLLAIANIDVKLSKGKWNKRAPANETSYTINRTISNAWVAKMIQAYKKAEISFPNDPAFEKIQKLYYEKAIELKIIKK